MALRKNPKPAKDPERQFQYRRSGVEQKLTDIYYLTGAKISLMIEKDGELFGYETHRWDPNMQNVPVRAALGL